MVARGRGWQERGELFHGCRVSAGKMKKVKDMDGGDGGDGCTAVSVYFMPQNRTLQHG